MEAVNKVFTMRQNPTVSLAAARLVAISALRAAAARGRISCCAAVPMAACEAFFKESRMQFPDPTHPNRRSGENLFSVFDS
jgi:hypothetical protein